MSRIIAIDYGLKRTGLAVTDCLQIIAMALDSIATRDLTDYLKKYMTRENVSALVLGLPKDLNNRNTNITLHVTKYYKQLHNIFPEKKIYLIDERYTSKIAVDAMVRSGAKKKDRKKKGNIDKISATIILQSFLEKRDFQLLK